jgi:uncharacterized OB-fold protein
MSDARITSLIERKTVQPARSQDHDAWEAFRQIEIITLELTQSYRHSLGKYSRFFLELENKKIFGTQCPTCQRVYTPPRPLCPDCLHITDWQELSGQGTLATYSVMHFASGVNEDVRQMQMPVILAYVLLDGSSTLFPHLLKAAPEQVRTGMRVRVAYSDTPVQHPIHMMYFVPSEE